MNKTILYKLERTGKIRQWSIWVDDTNEYPRVYVQHGQVDGAMQITFDEISVGKNLGRSNETTPFEQAQLEMKSIVKKKTEEGYKDSVDQLKQNQGINWDERMLKAACPYKPKNSITLEKRDKLEKSGNMIRTLKRDGMNYFIRKTEKFGVEIYSRRVDIHTEKFPHLVEAFQSLPNKTILYGEMSLINENGEDAFNKVSEICRCDTEKALARQSERDKMKYYVYDLPYWESEQWITSYVYRKRLDKIIDLVKNINNKYVLPVEEIDIPCAEFIQMIKDNKIVREGLVVWDNSKIMKDNEWLTWNGKAYRPNLVYKVKPVYEDDFIVRFNPENGIGSYGKGKNNGKIKSAAVYQLDNNDNEIYLGLCGGALTDEQRDLYTDVSLFPRVWRILFDEVQPKTGYLRFARLDLDRTLIDDKQMSECILNDKSKRAMR